MNKKLIYLLGGTVIVLFIFVIYLIFQQRTPTPKTVSQTASASGDQPSSNGSDNTSTGKGTQPSHQTPVAPTPSTAAGTARAFYKLYFSSANNPLANGAYKTTPYLSTEFKEDIGKLYKNGNTPVFCPQNERSAIVVGQEQQVFYDNGYLTQVVISEAPPGKKDLYRLLLHNLTGHWLIVDINCIR